MALPSGGRKTLVQIQPGRPRRFGGWRGRLAKKSASGPMPRSQKAPLHKNHLMDFAKFCISLPRWRNWPAAPDSKSGGPRPWRFESSPGHHLIELKKRRFPLPRWRNWLAAPESESGGLRPWRFKSSPGHHLIELKKHRFSLPRWRNWPAASARGADGLRPWRFESSPGHHLFEFERSC